MTPSQGEVLANRYRPEARHSGGLSHPNIATVHDFGEDDGTPYLVTELLVGEPLSALVRARSPLPQPEVRDIKPANIVVDPDASAPPAPNGKGGEKP